MFFKRDNNTDGRSVGETTDPEIQWLMGSRPPVGGLRDPAMAWLGGCYLFLIGALQNQMQLKFSQEQQEQQ